jgi:hypothetical protein
LVTGIHDNPKPSQPQVAGSSGADPLTVDVSSSCLSRPRSVVACRWSSQATSGSSGRNRPEEVALYHLGEPAAGQADRLHQPGAFQALLPVVGVPLEAASGLDPVDGGVGAEAHA